MNCARVTGGNDGSFGIGVVVGGVVKRKMHKVHKQLASAGIFVTNQRILLVSDLYTTIT